MKREKRDFAKGFSTVNIDVSLKLAYGVGESSTSCDNSSNSYGSSCAFGSGTGSEIVPIKELKSRLWAFNLKHVGQIFVDVNYFRLKVLQYSIETGYKYQFLKNDLERVTVYCAKRKSTSCLWRVHVIYEFDSFVIKTMHSKHFCGFVCKDVNSYLMSSKLVENLILEIVRGMPLVKPRDLMTTFKTDYRLDIIYYYVYTAKKMALEEIHASHHEFFTCAEKLKKYGGLPVQRFLTDIRLENWANAYFRGYGEMCSTLAECFNAWITKERFLPITPMLFGIMKKMMEMSWNRLEESMKWNSVLCPKMEIVLASKVPCYVLQLHSLMLPFKLGVFVFGIMYS
ncbi:hypothetical protein IFM89_027216 [Coptis chinensis]|uniref:Transposase MuDR plant domain-containing protein n=1 Tax=Coptis chinensis TaxID=261450 RepID=A0A835LBU7_9MAGN|nr:hypothetical protein IFM89_027216 [Coptis chinensis]